MHVSALTPPPTLSDAEMRAVGPRIRFMLPQLTPLEARVVDLVLGSRDFTELTPLQQVATAADVSEAMVVKVAKKLNLLDVVVVAVARCRRRRSQPGKDDPFGAEQAKGPVE